MSKIRRSVENYSDILKKSIDRAFRGGISGGIAMAINICTLMPLEQQLTINTGMEQIVYNLLKHFIKMVGYRFYRGFDSQSYKVHGQDLETHLLILEH